MIAARSFAHQDTGVFGLARSGLASVRALKAGGARVYAWDDKESARIAAEAEGATVLPWRDWPWAKIKALILSPGVPLTHPAPHEIVLKARAFEADPDQRRQEGDAVGEDVGDQGSLADRIPA